MVQRESCTATRAIRTPAHGAEGKALRIPHRIATGARYGVEWRSMEVGAAQCIHEAPAASERCARHHLHRRIPTEESKPKEAQSWSAAEEDRLHTLAGRPSAGRLPWRYCTRSTCDGGTTWEQQQR